MPGGRLIVLDDEEDICELVSRTASGCGYDVFATTNPRQFLDHIRTHPPAVVVLDLKIPGMDGVEVLRRLPELGTTADILLISGVGDRVLDTAFRIGRERGLRMVGVLSKPVRVAELREMLTKISQDDVSAISDDRLSEAIVRGELVLHYQPVKDLKAGRIYGVEALVRWQHPGRGLLLPADFVPLAETCGLADPLADWVAEKAIRQAADWKRQGTDLLVSINVSATTLHDYGFPDRLERLCAGVGVEPSRLAIEMTETAAMQDATRLMDVLTRFRIKGFQLSLDDFGTAYSSLVQLRRLPFSSLKIDRSFVSSMLESQDDAVIVDTIIGMGRNLKLLTIAEGVESDAILKALAAKGCDFAQGYHIAKPMPAENIPDFVAAA